MGWREVEAERRRIVAEKATIRVWRDTQLKTAEANRRKAHADLEEAHKLEVAQIKNSAFEQYMRLEDAFADFKEGQQR